MGCGCGGKGKKPARRPGGVGVPRGFGTNGFAPPAPTAPPTPMASPTSMGMVNLPAPIPGDNRRIKQLNQQAILRNRGLA